MFITKALDVTGGQWLYQSDSVVLSQCAGKNCDGDVSETPILSIDDETTIHIQDLNMLIVETSEGRTVHNFKVMHNDDQTFSVTNLFGEVDNYEMVSSFELTRFEDA